MKTALLCLLLTGCASMPGVDATDAERKAQRDQGNAICLQHGNLFWGTVQNEVDSIEFHHLGYQKAILSDLNKYLKLEKCAINNTFKDPKIAGASISHAHRAGPEKSAHRKPTAAARSSSLGSAKR